MAVRQIKTPPIIYNTFATDIRGFAILTFAANNAKHANGSLKYSASTALLALLALFAAEQKNRDRSRSCLLFGEIVAWIGGLVIDEHSRRFGIERGAAEFQGQA